MIFLKNLKKRIKPSISVAKPGVRSKTPDTNINKQKQVIETNQSSIDAVDSYRIQNNQKVADVLNRLNGLTRDLQAIETELKAIKEEEGSNEQSP